MKIIVNRFKSYLSEELQKTTDLDDPSTPWEYLNILIKDFSVSYSKKLTQYIEKSEKFY